MHHINDNLHDLRSTDHADAQRRKGVRKFLTPFLTLLGDPHLDFEER
jgi:hypothetical protein